MSSPRRMWWFLAITFATTWSAWGLLALLTRTGTVELTSAAGTTLLVVGGSAPMVSAYLAAWRTPEAGSLRELTRRVLQLRAPVSLWGLAVFGAAAIGLAAMAFARLVTHVRWPGELGGVAVLFGLLLVTSIVFGGTEEVGWRGVLQPAVSARWALPVANLVIAGIWTVWHLPPFWVAGGSHADASFAVFLLAGIGYSAVMTWLYARPASRCASSSTPASTLRPGPEWRSRSTSCPDSRSRPSWPSSSAPSCSSLGDTPSPADSACRGRRAGGPVGWPTTDPVAGGTIATPPGAFDPGVVVDARGL